MLNRYYESALKNYYVDALDTFRAFDELYFSPKTCRDKSSVYRVETDDNSLTLSIDVPGVKSEELTCSTSEREVKVTGKCRGEEFKYLYTVSKSYDVANPEATLENGVLSIKFKKAESLSRNVKITVK